MGHLRGASQTTMPLKDKKKRVAYIAKWRKANPQKVRAWWKTSDLKRASDPVYLTKRKAQLKRYKTTNKTFIAKLQHAYYARNAEVLKNYRKNWWDTLRDDVRRLMGSKCACCERQPEFLTLDHIRNDGYKERTERGNRNPYIAYSEIKRAFKSGRMKEVRRIRRKYQLLCWNCNASKRHRSGLCAHKRKTLQSASE
jgi:hypothetical protein